MGKCQNFKKLVKKMIFADFWAKTAQFWRARNFCSPFWKTAFFYDLYQNFSPFEAFLRKIWGNVKISKIWSTKMIFGQKRQNFGARENFSAFLEKLHFFTTIVKIPAHLKHFFGKYGEMSKISQKLVKKMIFGQQRPNFGARNFFSPFLEKLHFFTTYVKISAHLKHFCGKYGEMSKFKKSRQKSDFWAKTAKFWRTRIFFRRFRKQIFF
jgi:hypothetical protein